jgi:prepilin-type N-terminal cleavage/methylation domain-containing protein
MMRKNNRGFTLIELIIVLAILLTLTSITTVLYSPSRDHILEGLEKEEFRIVSNAIKLAEIYNDIPKNSFFDSENPTEESLLEYSKRVSLENHLVPDYLDKIPNRFNNPWDIYELPDNPTSRDKGRVVGDTLITMLEDGAANLQYNRFSYSSLTYNGNTSPFITDPQLKAEIISRAGLEDFPNIDNYIMYLYSGLNNLHIIRINHPDRSETNIGAIRQLNDGSWEFVPYGQGYN